MFTKFWVFSYWPYIIFLTKIWLKSWLKSNFCEKYDWDLNWLYKLNKHWKQKSKFYNAFYFRFVFIYTNQLIPFFLQTLNLSIKIMTLSFFKTNYILGTQNFFYLFGLDYLFLNMIQYLICIYIQETSIYYAAERYQKSIYFLKTWNLCVYFTLAADGTQNKYEHMHCCVWNNSSELIIKCATKLNKFKWLLFIHIHFYLIIYLN